MTWQQIRQQVLERDGYQCVTCGQKLPLDVHHVIPRRFGRLDTFHNLVSSCNKCHKLLDFGWKREIRKVLIGNDLHKVKFISTISKMGDYRVIRIPSKIQKNLESMEGKDIRVMVDDEF